MQKFRSKITMTMMGLAALSTMIAACTKELPYKTVYKGQGDDQVQEKSLLPEDTEYLFVGSSDLANQDSTGAADALPYWQGEEKIVKFKFTENSLQIVQVNEEARLQDNKLNEKVIFDIPVDHVDFRCATDRYDKCTNKEEKNDEVSWKQKSKFVPKFSDMKSTSFNMLPVEMDKVYGQSCFEETDSKLVGYELTDAALNVQIRKTFKADLKCIWKKGLFSASMDDLQAQIIYHYSFTKLNSMASPDYKIVNYPENDESVFGFFTTNNRKYDVDYSRAYSMKTQYMNRWNPEKKELVYYMTDNFNKPEMKAIKEATYKAFDRVNAGLKAAGMATRMVLKEPDHKIPGDVRNSMIILVEDPVAGGPLGYGPTVANPRTGEIMSGRVAMYYGNYLQSVRYSYDEVVRELRREQNDASAADKAKGGKPNIKGINEVPENKAAAHFSNELQAQFKLASAMKAKTSFAQAKTLSTRYNQLKQAPARGGKVVVTKDSPFTKNALMGMTAKSFSKAMLQTNKQNTLQDSLAAMSKYCNYPAELFPFNEIIRNALQAKLGNDLKPWAELSRDERKAVLDIIMPEVWLPTLVHELGHNLGLRHNFGGSEDKANFYTKDELNAMGVSHEIPYSSVMDYGYSELNLLPTLGKYDIAALRFGYKREIDTADGKTLTVKTTADDLKKELAKTETELKDYSYCSDEHVEVNPNCKRFDRGTTMTEIVSYLIQSYDEYYTIRNFRNDRESFSKLSDGAYYGGNWSRFMYIRAFMERYESIKYRFSLADDAKEWNDIAFLKDLKQAAIISGKFFIRVLETPEQVCAIAKAADPTTIVSMGRLEDIDPQALSCFDVKLKPEYQMIGETGKVFNDKKDPNSDNHYADQIDVRGQWADKLAAIRALLARQIDNSNYDEHEDNYLDIPEVAGPLTQTITNLLFNTVDTDVTFRDKNGLDLVSGRIPVEVFSSPQSMKSSAPIHWIETPLDESVARQVGIPMQQTSFQQVLLTSLVQSMNASQSHQSESNDFLTGFSVIKTSKAYQLDQNAKGTVKDIGLTRYVALDSQKTAQQAMALGQISALLDKLTPAQFDTLIAEKTAEAQGKGPAVSALPVEYKPITLDIAKAYQTGKFPSQDLMNYLLSILPAAN